MHDHEHHHASVPAGDTPNDRAVCPVMQLPVSVEKATESGLKRTYNDKDYYLCCSGCAADFDNDPASFAK